MSQPTNSRPGGKPADDGFIDETAIEAMLTCSQFRANGRFTVRDTFEAVRRGDRLEAAQLAERIGIDARTVARIRVDLRAMPGRISELDAYPADAYRKFVIGIFRATNYSDLNWLVLTDRQLIDRTITAVQWGINDIPRQHEEAAARLAGPGLAEKRHSAKVAIRTRANRLAHYLRALQTIRREFDRADGNAPAWSDTEWALEGVAA